MRTLLIIALLAVAAGGGVALWWTDRGAGSAADLAAPTDSSAAETCTSCAARHQRVTKSKTTPDAE